MNNSCLAFEQLYQTIKRLRLPNGCPWDREQTADTLIPHLLEESYELLDAIKEANEQHIKEELGDVYLVLTMLATVYEEEAARTQGQAGFTLDELLTAINQKIIRRHPHVFGDSVALTAEEGLASWQAAKKAEGRAERSTFDKVGRGLPPLERAAKIEQKMMKIGYSFGSIQESLAKVDEELNEFKAEVVSGEQQKQEDELGDLFLTLVMTATQLDIDPALAIHRANNKVTSRMNFVEQTLAQKNISLKEATIEQMEKAWQQAKQKGL